MIRLVASEEYSLSIRKISCPEMVNCVVCEWPGFSCSSGQQHELCWRAVRNRNHPLSVGRQRRGKTLVDRDLDCGGAIRLSQIDGPVLSARLSTLDDKKSLAINRKVLSI